MQFNVPLTAAVPSRGLLGTALGWVAGFLPGLISKWLLPVCGSLALGILALWSYHMLMMNHMETRLRQVQTQVGTMQVDLAKAIAQRDNLQTALKDQNEAIDRLIEANEARSKAAEAAIKKAALQAQTWKTKYDRLLKAPPKYTDECKSLSETIDAYLQLRRQEKSP